MFCPVHIKPPVSGQFLGGCCLGGNCPRTKKKPFIINLLCVLIQSIIHLFHSRAPKMYKSPPAPFGESDLFTLHQSQSASNSGRFKDPRVQKKVTLFKSFKRITQVIEGITQQNLPVHPQPPGLGLPDLQTQLSKTQTASSSLHESTA